MTTIERVKKEYRFYTEKEKHHFLQGCLACQKLTGNYEKPLFKLLLELEQYTPPVENKVLLDLTSLQKQMKEMHSIITQKPLPKEVKVTRKSKVQLIREKRLLDAIQNN